MLFRSEQDAMVSSILADLEQAGHDRPETLPLPASLTGIIRDLIETRSGIEAEFAAATRELKRAEDNLQRLRDEGEVQTGDTPEPAVIARIEIALARLDGSDLQSRLVGEERALAQQQRLFQTQFAQLSPWSGAPDDLRSMPTAEPRQIEAWRTQATTIDRRITDHKARLRELVTEQRQFKARIATFEMQGPIDDSAARTLRHERDTAWQDHLRQLDITSARNFEARLHKDDALSAERLSRAQELAELRQLTQAIATNAASIGRQEELLAEAETEAASLFEKIAALLPTRRDVLAELPELLSTLESWAGKRSQALTAWEALEQAEARADEIKSDLQKYVAELVSALQDGGHDDADQFSPAELARAAAGLLAQAKTQRVAQANHEKTLANAERDLTERRRDRDDAKSATEVWQGAWRDALEKTWFADKAGSVPAVREILKVLAALPGMLRERELMAQRVTTMERDQSQFRAEISNILDDLGEALDTEDTLAAADMLASRHNAALRARQSHLDRQADLSALIENRRQLEEQLAVHNAGKAELTAFFGADTLTAVSLSLEQVRDRERLEARIAELRRQVTEGLRTTSYQQAEALLASIDTSDVERQATELSARIEDLTERTRQLYADMTRARDKLDAVGGDDAVARIEAQRRTIFLEIEDLAIRYLKLKVGTAAAEQALHLYRENHRSSMMNRASDAFRMITGGNYAGLAARPDKDKEILIGLARDGGSKLAEAMSTGTQFQLYLALRLAGYEEFAAVRPSVPFIADDIMESFDNPRSEEVFRLLGEMAGVGQVIYLTHHWHLCEIARNVVPGVRIHEIS